MIDTDTNVLNKVGKEQLKNIYVDCRVVWTTTIFKIIDQEITFISVPLTICGYQNFPDKLVHFQGKSPIFTKIVVDGSMDRTTSGV